MDLRYPALGVLAGALIAVPAPVAADSDAAGLTITPAALETLRSGDLTVAAAGAADAVGPASFTLPVTAVRFRPSGAVKTIRTAGGLTISGTPLSLDLTSLRLNLPAQQASVRASEPGMRIPAFDVVRTKVTKKRVSGVLLIAPGTASVLNEQFDTYVFSDGLRFARFVYPR